jgi:hypothetical protein
VTVHTLWPSSRRQHAISAPGECVRRSPPLRFFRPKNKCTRTLHSVVLQVDYSVHGGFISRTYCCAWFANASTLQLSWLQFCWYSLVGTVVLRFLSLLLPRCSFCTESCFTLFSQGTFCLWARSHDNMLPLKYIYCHSLTVWLNIYVFLIVKNWNIFKNFILIFVSIKLSTHKKTAENLYPKSFSSFKYNTYP